MMVASRGPKSSGIWSNIEVKSLVLIPIWGVNGKVIDTDESTVTDKVLVFCFTLLLSRIASTFLFERYRLGLLSGGPRPSLDCTV